MRSHQILSKTFQLLLFLQAERFERAESFCMDLMESGRNVEVRKWNFPQCFCLFFLTIWDFSQTSVKLSEVPNFERSFFESHDQLLKRNYSFLQNLLNTISIHKDDNLFESSTQALIASYSGCANWPSSPSRRLCCGRRWGGAGWCWCWCCWPSGIVDQARLILFFGKL